MKYINKDVVCICVYRERKVEGEIRNGRGFIIEKVGERRCGVESERTKMGLRLNFNYCCVLCTSRFWELYYC